MLTRQTSLLNFFQSERNPAVSNRLTRSSAPPGVNNNPGPADPAGSQANNGVGDLFDRLFHPTGATARNSTRAATAPALGAPIQLRNSASSSTGSNGNSVLRASSVVQRLIDDVRSRPSPGASSAAIERQLVGDNPRVGPDNLNQERPRSESVASIDIITIGEGPPNQPSFPRANLNAAEVRRNWSPTTELVFQTHLRYKQAYLEALAGANQEAMGILRDQAMATHQTLEQLIGRETLLVLTEGWTPPSTRPNHRAARSANQQNRGRNRHQAYARPNHVAIPPGAPQPSQAQGNRPSRMRGRQNYKASIYAELFCMGRTIQGGYQAIDQSRSRNQGHNN
ncbi:hypothetical protein PTTG_27339 [Puccinia triticina 1-1 BBBD Race 1]|uniref:Uncharacterized protein n=1 Tax=Puccinia triticina (isolate 1-1 / race 1 (BBBD)) TaxID=630390 RepID=A0A180GLN4_PUCT1|nr:hypothetical protein PTTG_27339 [Puccinia triticina 1-1 BBBD Race 1]